MVALTTHFRLHRLLKGLSHSSQTNAVSVIPPRPTVDSGMSSEMSLCTFGEGFMSNENP